MLRMLCAVAAIAAVSSALAQAPKVKTVDLNSPGALERLLATNADHYCKVRAILAGLSRYEATGDAVRWLEVTFDAKNVHYRDMWRTSFPAQRDISFVLGDTRYEGRLSMRLEGALAMPMER